MRTPEAPPNRRPWLVVGSEPIGRDLAEILPDVDLQVVGAGDLPARLPTARPRLVVVVQPPASDIDVAAAAAERRRPRSATRIVLLTDDDAIGSRLDALEAGFDDALPASLDRRELAVRLRRLDTAARLSPSRSPIRIAEDVELDLHAYELRRNGVAQRLRPKELQLLALLATHPRRAFSRRELIDRVWGTSFAGDPRTIDVHLRWLRAKVEDDAEHPVHLVTIRGRGYRFDPPALTNR